MKGQWIGRTTGDQIGQIVINIDDRDDFFSGVAFTIPDDTHFPQAVSFFSTKDRSPDFNFTADVSPIDPRTGLVAVWENIQNIYPGRSFSKKAEVSGHFKENELVFRAYTDIGLKYESHITKKPFSDLSDLPGEKKTWVEYKKHVDFLAEREFLFRGQSRPWKLRTAFHRRGRYDLFRFVLEDIPLLYRRLTSRTKHVFNLSNPDENGAFYNLVQHHGYPTPLLDWTFSPYVAAFFAFRHVPKRVTENEFVRIFIYDQKKWKLDWRQLLILNVPGLHLSIMEFIAIDNERLIPQQAATTVTNIDDIEEYVHSKEGEKNYRYLTAVDIPYQERAKVIKELSYMGITAGSMFPGLDGACEELREKLFGE